MKATFRGGQALSRRPAGCDLGWGLAVVLALGALWAAPVAAQDVDWEGLSERFVFEDPPGLMAASETQTSPSVACDTTLAGEAWVVWEEYRLGDADIFGARLTSEGVVRDSSGFPIAIGPDRQTTPRIAAGGGTFLAVWQATDPEQTSWRIEGLRLSPEGTTLDASPLLITRSSYPLQDIDLAFGAGQFMVIWSDTLGGTYTTRGVRVSAGDGEVLDESAMALTAEGAQQSGAAIAFDGENYLLAYSRQVAVHADTTVGEIAGRFVSAAGEPFPETFQIEPVTSPVITTSDDAPMLAFSGERYLAAWPSRVYVETATSNRRMYARTVSRDGTCSDRTVVAQDLRTRESRRIAANADGFELTWVTQLGQNTTYYGVHVDSVGASVTSESSLIPLVGNRGVENPGGCGIVWNGTRFVFVAAVQYLAVSGDDQDIRVSLLDTTGAVLSGPAVLTRAAPMQVPRAVAYDGSRYFIVWDEQVTGGWQVRGAFVTEEGTMAGEPFTVLSETRLQPWDPALATGNGSFVLAWIESETQSLYAARFDASGQPFGSRLQVNTLASGRPAVGWDGEQFALAWKQESSGAGIFMGRLRLDENGLAAATYDVMLPDSTIAVRSSVQLYAGTSSDPGLVCSGENCLVVWSRKGFGVYGVLVADSGWDVPLLPTQIAPGADSGVPRGVFDGANYFLAWSDHPEVYAARLRRDGVLLDPGRIPLDLESQTVDRPSVATDGSNRLAVWRTTENSRWVLRGSRHGADGLAVAGDEAFAGLELSVRWPVIVKGPSGQALFVYSSYSPDSEHGSLRLYGKLWQQQPPSIDIAIHQNPGVTSDINVLATPSEYVPAGQLTIRANGTPIDVHLVDGTHNLYAGWYQARATEVVSVVATVGDSAGNVTRAERSFGIGEITPNDGGSLAGPNGVLALTCPPRALEASSYVMILPDRERATNPGTMGFLLSPAELELRAAAALAVLVPDCPSELDPTASLPILERKTVTGWKHVPAGWSASAGRLSAAITRLGIFRVRWVAAADAPGATLALSLGPAPWRTDLTLRYRLPESGPVRLVVFDAAGRLVATLVDGFQEGGREHAVLWNGMTAGGGQAGSGVYFAQLRYGGRTVTRRSIRVQ